MTQRDDRDGVLVLGHAGRPVLVFPSAERDRRHEAYERWVLERVEGDDVITTGVSMGAYHAANLPLRHPHRFPLALCFSGVYFNNPLDDVPGLDGSPASTFAFAETLSAQGIRHELDVWGEDAPHDWPAWRAQLAKHLPRFV